MVQCPSDDSRNRFLVLADHVHLLKGSGGAALYDLREQRIWAIPAVFVRVLELCSEGLTLDRALTRSFGKRCSATLTDVIERFARRHPALDLAPAPDQRPSPPPLRWTIRPTWLMLEITNACNLRCRHCYVPSVSASDGHTAATLSTPRWIELLIEARGIGFVSLQLTGGEPTVHSDLPLLLRTARGLGYRPVALFTNLVSLSDDLLTLLRELDVQVHSSLYSHDAPTHDSITGCPGSFDRTVNGLRRVVAAGIETYVSMVVMEENAASRRETAAFLNRIGIGSTHIKVGLARPQGRGADLRQPAGPLSWPRKFDQWEVENETYVTANTCWAGRAAVSAQGDVYVCVGERLALGNVASASLRSVVESPAMRQLWRVTLDDVPQCRPCEFRYGCFDCRADAHLLTGDLFGRDSTCPYDPETAQWRYEGSAMNDKPKRRDGLVSEDVDGDLLVVDFGAAQMHVLNPMAAAVWELCNGQNAIENIGELLASHFQVPIENVRSDVARIVGEFRAKGLIEQSD